VQIPKGYLLIQISMALLTTYAVYLLLKKLADTIVMAQSLSGFPCLQELKSSYTAMNKHMNYFKNPV